MKKEDVRLIVTDLDNTLMGADRNLSARSRRVIERCAAAGIPFVPVSGRPYEGMAWARELREIPYYIYGNGAVCLRNGPEEELFHRGISREAALRTFEIFCRERCRIHLVTQRQTWSNRGETRYAAADEEEMRLRILDPVERLLKVDGFFEDPALRRQVWRELERDKDLSVSAAWPFIIEVNGAGADKGSAVVTLAERLGIPTDKVLAFGDEVNDISMLRCAGWGTAMENAVPEAKAAARLIAPPNVLDGEAAVIEALVFGDDNEWTPVPGGRA